MQTCRGSHTHTLVPKDKQTLYVYGSGTGGVRSGEELVDCSGGDPKENPNTALFSIDVIEVPLGAPEKARVVNRPRIFADEKTGAIAGLYPGGDHGPGTQRTSTTNQCHDITVYPGGRPRGRRLLGQRHPDGHLGSGQPEAPRSRRATRTSPTGTRRRSTTTAPR